MMIMTWGWSNNGRIDGMQSFFSIKKITLFTCHTQVHTTAPNISLFITLKLCWELCQVCYDNKRFCYIKKKCNLAAKKEFLPRSLFFSIRIYAKGSSIVGLICITRPVCFINWLCTWIQKVFCIKKLRADNVLKSNIDMYIFSKVSKT